MRKSFCFLLLIVSIFSSDSHAQTVKGQVTRKILQDDSIVVRLKRSRDSLEAADIRERDNMNRRAFLRMAKEQEEHRKKEKRRAYIRIGIGIVLLIVLVLGWNRRGKKTATP
ncbi:MAG TPA: hypothetical protein VLJ68_03045 [Chitinophagaceae bacterium]|nr:hypothetical protein [Chitinophagaceae bacterium]